MHFFVLLYATDKNRKCVLREMHKMFRNVRCYGKTMFQVSISNYSAVVQKLNALDFLICFFKK